MLRKLLPILLALIGLGGGVGAGLFLRPTESAEGNINPCGPDGLPTAHDGATEEDSTSGHGGGGHDSGEGEASEEYVKLNNQFIVPVVEAAQVRALAILSISLAVKPGSTEAVYAQEPKLRDAFLQVLFDHANAGGFDGAFTSSTHMDVLRQSLLETARDVLGKDVRNVLIVDIVRQDSQ